MFEEPLVKKELASETPKHIVMADSMAQEIINFQNRQVFNQPLEVICFNQQIQL